MDELEKNLEEMLEAVKALKAQMLDTNDALDTLLDSSHVKSVMTIFRNGEAKNI